MYPVPVSKVEESLFILNKNRDNSFTQRDSATMKKTINLLKNYLPEC
jgi:hypothetical protein